MHFNQNIIQNFFEDTFRKPLDMVVSNDIENIRLENFYLNAFPVDMFSLNSINNIKIEDFNKNKENEKNTISGKLVIEAKATGLSRLEDTYLTVGEKDFTLEYNFSFEEESNSFANLYLNNTNISLSSERENPYEQLSFQPA